MERVYQKKSGTFSSNTPGTVIEIDNEGNDGLSHFTTM
jgi:hypothetical protein